MPALKNQIFELLLAHWRAGGAGLSVRELQAATGTTTSDIVGALRAMNERNITVCEPTPGKWALTNKAA